MIATPVRHVIAIVPALNEAASIADVVRATLAHVDEVIVVDDGSTDATAELAATAGATVLSHPRRLGVGAAIASGLSRAAANGATAVVQVDGDGQHDPSSVPTLLAAIDAGADLVVGTRFETGFDMGFARRAVTAAFAWTISRRLNTRISDPTSGFRAFSRRAVAELTPVFPLKYLSDTVEVLYLAADRGLRVSAVPVRMRARTGGKPSAGTLKSIGYALRMSGIVARHMWAHGSRQRADGR